MKRCRVLFSTLLLFAVLTSASDAQVLWRGAKTMKKGSIITMGMMYYMDFTKKYSGDADDWKSNPNDQSDMGLQLMVGYAVTDRLETMVHIPVAFKSLETPALDDDTGGIGDIYFKARYAIVPWTKDKHGFTFIGSLRLPTGKDDEAASFLNTGDGTVDLGLGGIFTTKWVSGFRGHLKANYWLNGENDDDADIGDELKLIVKLDRNVTPKTMPFVCYIHYEQFDGETDSGKTIDGKSRNYIQTGIVYKPVSGLFLRPKVAFHFGGENGVMFDYKPMFDIWYIF